MTSTRAKAVGVEARPIIKNEEPTVKLGGGLGLGTVGKRKEERREGALLSGWESRPLLGLGSKRVTSSRWSCFVFLASSSSSPL